MQLSAHTKRIITAITLLVLPILAVIFGGYVLLVILALFCGLTLLECYSLFWPGRQRLQTKTFGLLLAMLLLWALTAQSLIWTMLVLLVAFWTGNMLFLREYSKKNSQASYQDGMIFFGALLYIPLTLHLFMRMNPMECALLLAAVIVSDTAAFYAGTAWGKRKIWPQVSPKKSWVGSIGSMLGCMSITTAVGVTFGEAAWWEYTYLGIALNVAAQFGDFFESALKRKLGIKDSGNILPGHGGLLDRLDSILLALPVYIAAVTLFPELIVDPGFEQVFTHLITP